MQKGVLVDGFFKLVDVGVPVGLNVVGYELNHIERRLEKLAVADGILSEFAVLAWQLDEVFVGEES